MNNFEVLKKAKLHGLTNEEIKNGEENVIHIKEISTGHIGVVYYRPYTSEQLKERLYVYLGKADTDLGDNGELDREVSIDEFNNDFIITEVRTDGTDEVLDISLFAM